MTEAWINNLRKMSISLGLAAALLLLIPTVGFAVSEVNPCAAKTINPCAAKTLNPCAAKTLNPCAAKTLNPCAAKTLNPCAAKTLNPCAAKTLNPCAAKSLNPCQGKSQRHSASNPCNPCGGKNPCNPCGGDKVSASLFVQPKGVMLATGDRSKLVVEGKKLWKDPGLGKSGLACASCHVGNYALMNKSFAKSYPHRVEMAELRAGVKKVNAAEMVNFCMVVPMNGDPLPWGSQKLAALAAYVESIQPGYKPVKSSSANPCNPCGGKNPCNPCAGKNPCNPCAGK